MPNLSAVRTHSFNRYAPITLAEYFWENVDKSLGLGPNGDCWEWRGSRTAAGYGQVGFKAAFEDRVKPYAHRVAWLIETGQMPTLHVCHHCDNPPCVRFSHLFQGTDADNAADMARKGRGNGPHFLGEAHPMHKLVDAEVMEIRQLYKTGISVRRLARRFGVVNGTIDFIVRGQTWKHLLPKEDKNV
jgi:hypothetical protein